MQEPINLEKLSIVELESLAYRQIVLLERTKTNLSILNAEIEKKSKEDTKNGKR